MRHGLLRQKRRLEADFGANPFAFRVRRVCRMITIAVVQANCGPKFALI